MAHFNVSSFGLLGVVGGGCCCFCCSKHTGSYPHPCSLALAVPPLILAPVRAPLRSHCQVLLSGVGVAEGGDVQSEMVLYIALHSLMHSRTAKGSKKDGSSSPDDSDDGMGTMKPNVDFFQLSSFSHLFSLPSRAIYL